MSSLRFNDRRRIEELLGMQTGYVSDFSDATFEEFVEKHTGRDIHDERYTKRGTSKANKLRTFWAIESDYLVGTLLNELIDYHLHSIGLMDDKMVNLGGRCRDIANRLIEAGPAFESLKNVLRVRDSKHLAQLIERMESTVEGDPDLAIGSSKELVENTCKTILTDEDVEFGRSINLMPLIKLTVKQLKLTPDDTPDSAKGAQSIKQLLHKLAAIVHEMGELRALYGTGHGKDGWFKGLQPRHARLATGMAGTLVLFLFETHEMRHHTPRQQARSS